MIGFEVVFTTINGAARSPRGSASEPCTVVKPIPKIGERSDPITNACVRGRGSRGKPSYPHAHVAVENSEGFRIGLSVCFWGMDEPVKTESLKGQEMPKSKKSRKNGSVISGKMKKCTTAQEFGPLLGAHTNDHLELDVLDWVEAQNYEDDLNEFARSDATHDEFIAYLDHLSEGRRCALNCEPWTYIPPTVK